MGFPSAYSKVNVGLVVNDIYNKYPGAGADLGLGKGGFFFVRSNHAHLSHTHHY